MTHLSQEPDPEKETYAPEMEKPPTESQIKVCMTIERLRDQIHSIPVLIHQALVIDQALSNHFKSLKDSANEVIVQFNEQKENILAQFDSLLMPLAKEVLEELIRDAERLKSDLDNTLLSMQKMVDMDWKGHALSWIELHSKWHDRHELNQRILKLVSDRTSQLIDKDIRVIQDYQTQSLSRMSQKDDVFKSVEKRLAKATEEPLKHLVELKRGVEETASMKQASEWIAQLHRQRESCFDQVLMKIDLIVKDLVLTEEEFDVDLFKDLEEEMFFVEQELKHIHDLLPKLHKNDEKEFFFTEARLEGLRDHLEQFDNLSLPRIVRERLEGIFRDIEDTLIKVSRRSA
ncbi:hypothetical protein PNK_1341 [Candidatus Protochlamydia naegleriophila]|uniref:Uncharacterized protein n=1 Tax=Candidatus Protochlamydia naegleriophila TaxID=389348 RepID=A0A0U5CQ56_9BACT|nr:hypothetical protein [Candidatus Protochlamydia naegleriophila]CUI16956.1 hypothetical protein PNK_1341 [Candidatus Protochlamydia naegleriophila]